MTQINDKIYLSMKIGSMLEVILFI